MGWDDVKHNEQQETALYNEIYNRSLDCHQNDSKVHDLGKDACLLGTWTYGKESAPSRYSIRAQVEGKLSLEEKLPTGVWVTGALEKQGEWFVTQLATPDGQRVGMMRLQYVDKDGTIQSNVRSPNTAVWGKDIIATQVHETNGQKDAQLLDKPSKPVKKLAPSEVRSSVDALSKFFDTIEARIQANDRLSDSKLPALEAQAKLLQRGCGPKAAPRRPADSLKLARSIVAADTAITSALATSDPLGPFGYSISRLKTAGGSMTCSELTPAGAPLLAIPLSACWSAEAVKEECPKLASALSSALARNPQSKILKADSTWIALHMLHEKRAGSLAKAHRKAHLALMPAVPETLLAWNDKEMMSLHGSRWLEVTKQRQAKLDADYVQLTMELGSAGTAEVGIDPAGYAWACSMVQQLGLHFAAPDGVPVQVVVPGLELLEPDAEAPPSTEGARLEFIGDSTPTVVFYATQDYTSGSKVPLSHAGLASSTGYWLLAGCLQPLEINPCEHVELLLRLPVHKRLVEPNAWFWETVDGLEEALKRDFAKKPGDCLPPDVAEAEPLVEMGSRKGEPELRVRMRLSKEKLLPGRMALWRLGLTILAHDERVDKVMKEEQAVVNPFGVDACERRALAWLQKRIEWALQEFPSRPEDDAAKLMRGHTGSTLPRKIRGLRLVVAEKQVLSDAVEAIRERLAAPAAPTAKLQAVEVKGDGVLARLSELVAGEEPDEGSDLGHAVSHLRGCTQALEQIGPQFKSLISDRKFTEEAGKVPHEELTILQKLLRSSPLKPLTARSGQAHFTIDVAVKVCGEANKAELLANLACLEWAAGVADKAGNKENLAKVLMSSAEVKAKLCDFQAAHTDLKRLMTIVPTPTEEAVRVARTCALNSVVCSERVLAGPWTSCGATLAALRSKMKELGYMKAGAQWPWPARVPPVSNLADSFQAIWKEGKDVAKEARKTRNKVLSTTWWVMKEANKDLRALISLFVLREPMELARAVQLLGVDACGLLLQRCALSCYSSKDARLLEPEEAAKLTKNPAGAPQVIANVSLWPVEEDVLVAVDFVQDFWQEGGFEPVMYLGEDSKAMVSAASRQPSGKSVLDVCCGSGAHGLAALKRLAEKATFLDDNPRALRFAAFGAALSGLEDKATFVQGSLSSDGLPAGAEGPFDTIFAGLPFLPNPDSVITCSGPAFKNGGYDGERILASVMCKAPKLLAPGGSLTATCMVPDVDGFASRLKGWVGAASGYSTTVFRGKAIDVSDFAGRATPGCSEVETFAYFRSLQQAKVHTMSEGLVLLWAPPGQGGSATKVDVRPEHSGLWSDGDFLWTELERLLLAVGAGVKEEPLYELDWAKGKEAPEGDVLAKITPGTSTSTGASAYTPKVSKELRVEFSREKGLDGATWDDIVKVNGPGFSPPVLCDVLWSKVGGMLKGDKKAVPHIYSFKSRGTPFQWGMLEFQNIDSPETLVEALKTVGCRDRLTFEGGAFNVQKDYLYTKGGARRETKVSNYDILVVPVATKGLRATTPVVDMPNELLAIMKVVMKQLKKRAKPARIVLATCGCIGPSYVGGPGEQVPAAAPALGLIRTARKEVPQVPIIWLDSDELTLQGSSAELLTQIVFELEVATPKNGMWGVSTQERALMLLSNNRDVAYRKGHRFLPKLDFSARMPIFIGAEVLPLPRATAEGAILVTGGVGGIGLVAAETLVEAGAQCLVLSSKSGDVPKGVGIERRIQVMQEKDVTVVVEKCDTSKERDVQKLLERIRSTYGAVTAVVHCAGLLADAPLDEMDAGMMTHVFEPKAQGAYYLHKHTQEDELLAFVMFSSAAALRGSANQANYASACAYLDELARLRAGLGLPGVSVQWPGVDLSGRTVKDETLVGLGTVKQVVRQVVYGREPVQPVQAVLPAAYLVPSSPPVKSLLEPLLARASPELEREKVEQAQKPLGAGSERPKAPRVNW